MPRQARIIPPKGFLHIISRGNNRRKLFRTHSDFNAYIRLIAKLKQEEFVSILHYCLMPNHIHFIVGINEKSNLPRFMKRLNLKYFYCYKNKHGYIGHLWQDRYKSKIIETDEYLLQCGKYIELNPVRAHIVCMPEDYIYSSYLHYGFGKIDKLIDEDRFYLELGNDNLQRQVRYQQIIINEMAYKKLTWPVDNDIVVTTCNSRD